MLNTIKAFFETRLDPVEDRESHSIELATAALLIEVCRTDRLVTDGELQVVLRALQEKFGLGREEASTLMELAENEVRAAHDYYQFTSLINQGFTQAQKERVIELMWQVAYADTQLDVHELHLMG